jgi:hypothetical protein
MISQQVPEVLGFFNRTDKDYLLDFSYAGYRFGENNFQKMRAKIILVTDYGAVPNTEKC